MVLVSSYSMNRGETKENGIQFADSCTLVELHEKLKYRKHENLRTTPMPPHTPSTRWFTRSP